ncbi:hypothetical protein Tco_0409498 [Tanacetum coccineum]
MTLGGRGGELFWEGGDDFGVDVLRFHTCLTDILGFLEKLEWWFEQDIDKEEERFEGDEDGGELEDVGRRVKIQKKRVVRRRRSYILTHRGLFLARSARKSFDHNEERADAMARSCEDNIKASLRRDDTPC